MLTRMNTTAEQVRKEEKSSVVKGHERRMFKKDNIKKRLLMCVIGVMLSGIAVGFFKRAVFGVDPFQTLMSGLDVVIPIAFGTLYVIVNACMLLFSLIFDRHYVSLATFINLFLLGYVAQFATDTLFACFPGLNIVGRSVSFLVGITLSCIAASLYFTADLGVSTYDAVALIITETWKIGKFKYVRIITDLVCVIIGVSLYLLSGEELSGLWAMVGVGTIITAFFMGPLIDWFNNHLSRPLLYGRDGAVEADK